MSKILKVVIQCHLLFIKHFHSILDLLLASAACNLVVWTEDWAVNTQKLIKTRFKKS